MASGRKGEMVLGGRHLIGIFGVLVVLFGVVFTLGYLLGRSQYDTELATARDMGAEAAPAARASEEEDSVQSREPTSTAAAEPKAEPAPGAQTRPAAQAEAAPAPRVASAESQPAPRPAPAPEQRPPDGSLAPPLIPRGATVLQVAALVNEQDALVFAQALQEQDFPAFILAPTTDQYYRVQVGPYADAQSVSIAQRRLEAAGFDSFPRR